MVFPRSEHPPQRYVEVDDRTMAFTSPNKRRASDTTWNMPSLDPPPKRLRSSTNLGKDYRIYHPQAGQYCEAKGQCLPPVGHDELRGSQEQQQQQKMLPKLSFQQYRMREQLRAYMEEEIQRMRCDQKHRSCGYNYEACPKDPAGGA
ncbi:hypothetical protein Pmar_PMAR003235 [Perkinsus marinus ATCC 50983]|uniref:Uncharacterized protein n=1 Tax=Perkinsus marinus (strain ATCC 50983 / TXsc) TaxID=423536 RepID=C5LKJ5_PERM5|nr:hypothetical protein Pmar_PMAR003235 [Perkinsus marinus ATCC 50983]EER02762.1 hypothetical protein Pmar_PMAR003235 [Perkinsus marinus ATCC 50983]|eukprot:XP_002770946.1 hypothetical protein Pmar_PMAR003235 [Perkinsus marinus ATCC 50983]